jgi:hydroxysqualene synthase
MAVDQHYENFPVASILVPHGIRSHVVAIYRFARFADDIADEGDASDANRIAQLNELDEQLIKLWQNGNVEIQAVRDLQRLRISGINGIQLNLFQNLLSAFKQDVVKKRYASRDELLDYSRRSADPIGRLMLALVGVDDKQSIEHSDAICSALQLVNFWQDAAIDASRGRIYVPAEEFVRHGTSESGFPKYPEHRDLMRAQCDHACALLLSGRPLLSRLTGRFRWEIAFTIAGGQRILEKIAANNFDVRKRPTLRWYDSVRLLRLAAALLR